MKNNNLSTTRVAPDSLKASDVSTEKQLLVDATNFDSNENTTNS